MPELSSEAAKMKQEAEAALEDLEDQLQAQKDGDVPEGEKLSPEEIDERSEKIHEKLKEAKAIERVGDLQEVKERAEKNPEDVSEKARKILADGTVIGPEGTSRKEEENSVFGGSLNDFLKACVAASGGNVDYDFNRKEAAKMRQLQEGATALDQGNPFSEEEITDEKVSELLDEKAIQGDNNSALVPTVHMEELLRGMAEDQVFVDRATHVAMERRQVDFPRLDQADMSNDRPIFSIAAVNIIGEGGQKDDREPSFDQFTLDTRKYAAYTEASDELLAESIIDTQPFITENLTSAIGYEFDRDCMRGNGTGASPSEPQGFIGSAAEWEQNRANAGSVGLDDILGMEERFFGDEGIWMHHPSVIPDLYKLQSNNIIVWNPDLQTDAPGTLLGRPLARTHKLPTVGTKGDLCLVDPEFYIVGDMQQVTIATSRDFKFRNDLTAFRAVFRAAGEPWPADQFSMEASGGNATYNISPFTVLGPTASS